MRDKGKFTMAIKLTAFINYNKYPYTKFVTNAHTCVMEPAILPRALNLLKVYNAINPKDVDTGCFNVTLNAVKTAIRYNKLLIIYHGQE